MSTNLFFFSSLAFVSAAAVLVINPFAVYNLSLSKARRANEVE